MMPSSCTEATHSKSIKLARVSKSGRIIKTPKAVLTTSSDEAPRQRSSRKQVHVRTELQRLREIAKISLPKKTSVSDHEVTAPAATKELVQDVAISTNIEQANLERETRNSGNKSPLPECSGIQIAMPKKAKSTASSISQSNCSGSITPSPPRNELPNVEVNINIECENPITDLEENREKVSKVDLNDQVLESLKQIVQQNQKIKQQFKTIKKQNQRIITQQTQIIDGVLQRSNIDEEVSAKLYEPLEGFPLQSIEQFQEIENDSKKNIRKKLYLHLCNLGGSRVREFLNCALKEVMTDELVNSFTWPGGKNSTKLGDTKVANILYLAAKKCPLFRGPDTKAEFKTDMLEVLRTTKQRFRKYVLKKSLATDQVDETDDDEFDEFDEDDEQILQKIRRLEKRLNIRLEDEDVDKEVVEDFDADYDTDDQ